MHLMAHAHSENLGVRTCVSTGYQLLSFNREVCRDDSDEWSHNNLWLKNTDLLSIDTVFVFAMRRRHPMLLERGKNQREKRGLGKK